MTDWMWIVLILAALFGGTVYCGFRAIAAALEERAVMSEERSKIMDNLIAQDADLIETQARENERLRELLDAWLGLAREHLDTELAGRTFEALERTRK